MADYIINFSDPANGSFVIKPMTTNGPASPIAAAPLDPQAVSANTSLVLLGKGMWEYGERIAEDLVHLLEHFSYATAPAYPVQGQLWFKNTSPQSLNVLGSQILTINGVNSGTSTWTVSGNHAAAFDLTNPPGSTLTVVGNTNPPSNTLYNIVSATDVGPNTDIVVSPGSIPGASTATGTIQYAAWQKLLTNNLPIGGDLNMGGFKIINLGNPTNVGDALNLGYADGRYVNVTGDTMTGSLTMSGAGIHVILPNAPTIGTHATNKTYVDTLAANYVLKAGDTMTGTLILNGGNLQIQGTGNFTFNNAGIFDMATSRIRNMADPTLPQDAATKFYVDAAVFGGGTPANVLVDALGGGFNPATHTITIKRFDGGNYTAITGIAGQFELWQTTSIRHPLNPAFDSSYLREQFISVPQYPNDVPFQNTVDAMDQALFATSAVPKRMVLQGDGVTGTFLLDFQYLTFANKLVVYNNGVKQYASQRGQFIIDFDTPTVNIGSTTGLAAANYTFTIIVDGTSYPITVNLTLATPPINFYTLITAIDAGLVAAGAPATVFFRDSRMNFFSDAQGTASSVYINTSVGTLFGAIVGPTQTPNPLGSRVAVLTAATGPNRFTVTGDYTASFPAAGRLVVFGSAANDGTYIVSGGGSTFGAGVTTIPVTTAVTASGASGEISFWRDLSYEEDGTTLSPAAQGQNIIFNVTPAAGDIIEAVIFP